MGYAFISYSSVQQRQLDQVREFLKTNGISCWAAPDDIPIGSKYSEVIKRAIEDASCVLFLLSDRSQNSTYCKLEIALALQMEKPVIPIQLEDVILNDDFSLYLSRSDFYPMPGKITTSKTHKLLNQLRLLCADPDQEPVEPDDPSYKIGWFRKGTWLQIFGWIWMIGGFYPFNGLADICYPLPPGGGGNHPIMGPTDYYFKRGVLVAGLMMIGLLAVCYGFSLNRKKRGRTRLFFRQFSLCQMLLLISCIGLGLGMPTSILYIEHIYSPFINACWYTYSASFVLLFVTLVVWLVQRMYQLYQWCRNKIKQ